jgi:hypothetical protein
MPDQGRFDHSLKSLFPVKREINRSGQLIQVRLDASVKLKPVSQSLVWREIFSRLKGVERRNPLFNG